MNKMKKKKLIINKIVNLNKIKVIIIKKMKINKTSYKKKSF